MVQPNPKKDVSLKATTHATRQARHVTTQAAQELAKVTTKVASEVAHVATEVAHVATTAAVTAVRKTGETIEQTAATAAKTFNALPGTVASTARIIISAEERLRQRLRSALRVAVATVFLGISGLISLGANVTMAFAKKVSPESTRERRTKGHLKTRYHLRHSEKPLPKMTAEHARASHPTSYKLHGIASWYGREFNHRRTASGVRFDTHAMMAAHRTLPFGTKVRVTNLKNHRSCVVEITDRGPYARNRVIDLSYAAAEKIGMAASGTAEVQIEVLGSNLHNIVPDATPDYASAGTPEGAGASHDLETPNPVFDRIPSFPDRTLASILNQPELIQEVDGR